MREASGSCSRPAASRRACSWARRTAYCSPTADELLTRAGEGLAIASRADALALLVDDGTGTGGDDDPAAVARELAASVRDMSASMGRIARLLTTDQPAEGDPA